MNTINFAKGVGLGLVVGSAIGMVAMTNSGQNAGKHNKKNVMGKALKTVGDIVENIGEAMGM